MKSKLATLVGLFTVGWGILGLPAPALGQTIYAPYAITNLGGSPGGTFFFSSPYDVAVYHSTNIYVAGTYDYTIRKLTLTGGTNWVMTTLAGVPNASGTNDGMGAAARFLYPQCVTVDKDNIVYVADTGNKSIRKITPDGTVTTLATGLSDPIGLVVNSAGSLYVSDYGSNTAIKIVSPGGGVGTLISSAPGTVQWAGGLSLDSSNNVYVADSVRHAIYKISPGGSPTLIAGSPGNSGTNDGIGSVARFNVPNDVAVSASGDIFVADAGNSTLRRIRYDGSNWVVRTIAGSPGQFGTAIGTGSAARFRNLAGLVVDDNTGILYAADIVAGTIKAGVYVGPTNDFNSWTNVVNGRWEDGYNWSIDTPSMEDTINLITNAGTKVAVIDATTVSSSPNSLKINNLLVAAPDGDINGLALFNSGIFAPLRVAENLVIDSGGVVALTNGAITTGVGFTVGYKNGGGALNILSGSRVTSPVGYVGLNDYGANAVQISGAGSMWTNQTSFVIGYYSDGNGMLIDNGGNVSDQNGALGQGGDGNLAAVNGAGSVWRNSGTLVIGDEGGNGNSLTVANGGTVYVNGEMKIGTGGDSNVVTVANAGVLSCSGPLRLNQGGQSIYNALYIGTGASVATPSLSVSNGNFVGLAAGTLNTGGSAVNNGVVFPVGVGAEPATLRLNGGIHTFANGLEVSDHGILTGCGTIIGPVTIDPGGTVLPDSGCAITFASAVTNNGTILPPEATNVVFLGLVVNHGSILTNGPTPPPACPVVVTGSIINLADSGTYTVTDGTNSADFYWSLAGPGASGYVYATFSTYVALATGVTNIAQITNAAGFSFVTSAYNSIGPVLDAGANGGIGQFVVLRNKNSGNYAVVRMDDVLNNGSLNATWWFLSQSGSTNFGCVPPPPPAGPQPVTNLTLHATSGNLNLSFVTEPGRAYTIQMRTNLTSGAWMSVTNFAGDSLPHGIPISPADRPRAYYRILTQ